MKSNPLQSIQPTTTPLYRDWRLWQAFFLILFIITVFIHWSVPDWPETSAWRVVHQSQVEFIDEIVLVILCALLSLNMIQIFLIIWTYPLLSTDPIIISSVSNDNEMKLRHLQPISSSSSSSSSHHKYGHNTTRGDIGAQSKLVSSSIHMYTSSPTQKTVHNAQYRPPQSPSTYRPPSTMSNSEKHIISDISNHNIIPTATESSLRSHDTTTTTTTTANTTSLFQEIIENQQYDSLSHPSHSTTLTSTTSNTNNNNTPISLLFIPPVDFSITSSSFSGASPLSPASHPDLSQQQQQESSQSTTFLLYSPSTSSSYSPLNKTRRHINSNNNNNNATTLRNIFGPSISSSTAFIPTTIASTTTPTTTTTTRVNTTSASSRLPTLPLPSFFLHLPPPHQHHDSTHKPSQSDLSSFLPLESTPTHFLTLNPISVDDNSPSLTSSNHNVPSQYHTIPSQLSSSVSNIPASSSLSAESTHLSHISPHSLSTNSSIISQHQQPPITSPTSSSPSPLYSTISTSSSSSSILSTSPSSPPPFPQSPPHHRNSRCTFKQRTCLLQTYLWFQLILSISYFCTIIAMAAFAYAWIYIVVSSYFYQHGFTYSTKRNSIDQFIVTTSAGLAHDSRVMALTSVAVGVAFSFFIVIFFINTLGAFHRFKSSMFVRILQQARSGFTIRDAMAAHLSNRLLSPMFRHNWLGSSVLSSSSSTISPSPSPPSVVSSPTSSSLSVFPSHNPHQFDHTTTTSLYDAYPPTLERSNAFSFTPSDQQNPISSHLEVSFSHMISHTPVQSTRYTTNHSSKASLSSSNSDTKPAISLQPPSYIPQSPSETSESNVSYALHHPLSASTSSSSSSTSSTTPPTTLYQNDFEEHLLSSTHINDTDPTTPPNTSLSTLLSSISPTPSENISNSTEGGSSTTHPNSSHEHTTQHHHDDDNDMVVPFPQPSSSSSSYHDNQTSTSLLYSSQYTSALLSQAAPLSPLTLASVRSFSLASPTLPPDLVSFASFTTLEPDNTLMADFNSFSADTTTTAAAATASSTALLSSTPSRPLSRHTSSLSSFHHSQQQHQHQQQQLISSYNKTAKETAHKLNHNLLQSRLYIFSQLADIYHVTWTHMILSILLVSTHIRVATLRPFLLTMSHFIHLTTRRVGLQFGIIYALPFLVFALCVIDVIFFICFHNYYDIIANASNPTQAPCRVYFTAVVGSTTPTTTINSNNIDTTTNAYPLKPSSISSPSLSRHSSSNSSSSSPGHPSSPLVFSSTTTQLHNAPYPIDFAGNCHHPNLQRDYFWKPSLCPHNEWLASPVAVQRSSSNHSTFSNALETCPEVEDVDHPTTSLLPAPTALISHRATSPILSDQNPSDSISATATTTTTAARRSPFLPRVITSPSAPDFVPPHNNNHHFQKRTNKPHQDELDEPLLNTSDDDNNDNIDNFWGMNDDNVDITTTNGDISYSHDNDEQSTDMILSDEYTTDNSSLPYQQPNADPVATILLEALQTGKSPLQVLFYRIYISYGYFCIVRVAIMTIAHVLWLWSIWDTTNALSLENFSFSQDNYLLFLTSIYHWVTCTLIILLISCIATIWLYFAMDISQFRLIFFPAPAFVSSPNVR